MAMETGIEWADATANFWIGCTKISPACDHCYAERDWGEGGLRARVTWGPHGDRSKAKAGAATCRKLQREAADFYAEHGRKRRVFVNSLSDFGDNHRSILPEWRSEFWQIVRECPDLIFLILTKRPQNIPGYLPWDWMDGHAFPNVWIGTTAENQTEYDRRKPHLEAIPAALRFLSMEPLLSEVQMGDLSQIDWVICGGESGPDARPMHPDWARSLRDQCASAGVPFFFKQWGEWIPCITDFGGDDGPRCYSAGQDIDAFFDPSAQAHVTESHGHEFWRIGKKRAGHLLDGVAHHEFP